MSWWGLDHSLREVLVERGYLGPTSGEGRDYLLLEDNLFQAARGCWAGAEQEPGAVDMVDLRMSGAAGIVTVAGYHCLVEAASMQVAIHLVQAGEQHGNCSDPDWGLAQAQIGIETVLADIAAAVVAAAAVVVVVACSSGSQAVIVDGMVGWEADEGVAGNPFDTRMPCWDCTALEGCSTMAFLTSFAEDPLPEWISMWK